MKCCNPISGAVGLIKFTVGADRVSLTVFEQRHRTCSECDRATLRREGSLHPFSQCLECWCFLRPKLNLASEECPLKKWPLPVLTNNPTEPLSGK